MSPQALESPQSSDSTYHTVPTTPTSPLNTLIGDLDAYPHAVPDLLLDRRSPFNPALDTATHTPHGSPYSLTGPTTPPTLLPDLFSEPIVVPTTPVRLSPRSSQIHISDPFLQFEPQYGCLSDSSLASTLSYSTSAPGLSNGGKSAFDTLLGFNHLLHGHMIPTISDHFESAFFNTYAVL